MKKIIDPIDTLRILRSGQIGSLELYMKVSLSEFDADELIDLITRDRLIVIEKREDDE